MLVCSLSVVLAVSGLDAGFPQQWHVAHDGATIPEGRSLSYEDKVAHKLAKVKEEAGDEPPWLEQYMGMQLQIAEIRAQRSKLEQHADLFESLIGEVEDRPVTRDPDALPRQDVDMRGLYGEYVAGRKKLEGMRASLSRDVNHFRHSSRPSAHRWRAPMGVLTELESDLLPRHREKHTHKHKHTSHKEKVQEETPHGVVSGDSVELSGDDMCTWGKRCAACSNAVEADENEEFLQCRDYDNKCAAADKDGHCPRGYYPCDTMLPKDKLEFDIAPGSKQAVVTAYGYNYHPGKGCLRLMLLPKASVMHKKDPAAACSSDLLANQRQVLADCAKQVGENGDGKSPSCFRATAESADANVAEVGQTDNPGEEFVRFEISERNVGVPEGMAVSWLACLIQGKTGEKDVDTTAYVGHVCFSKTKGELKKEDDKACQSALKKHALHNKNGAAAAMLAFALLA